VPGVWYNAVVWHKMGWEAKSLISVEEKGRLIVGYKQVLRALSAKSCQKLFIAEDCSLNIFDSLKNSAGDSEVVLVPTMRELGTMCEIDVPSSCAAVLK
jgi:large subunit ribosomal protein L7A